MDLSHHYQTPNRDYDLHFFEEALREYGVSTVDVMTLRREHPGKAAEALSSKIGKPISRCAQFLESFDQVVNADLAPLYSIPTRKCISTSLSRIDAILQGGCPVGQITEVFGASGTGKSQFLLNLAINSQKLLNESGNPAECIYITTESPMETRRLVDFSKDTDLANIACIHCSDMDNQDHIIYTQLRAKLLLAKHLRNSVGTVIIDSVSHHLRASETYLNSIEYLRSHLEAQEAELASDPLYAALKMGFDAQTNKFFRSDRAYKLRAAKELYLLLMYRYLGWIAREFAVAIIVANQISDMMDFEEMDVPVAERFDPLNYEFQVGTFSGWDAPAFGPFEAQIDQSLCPQTRQPELTEHSGQIESIRLSELSPGDTSTQVPQANGLAAPRHETVEVHFEGSTLNRKRRIPALGYTWAKLVPHRILLWKKYQWNLQPNGNGPGATGHSAGHMSGDKNGELQQTGQQQDLQQPAYTQTIADEYEQFATQTKTKVRRFARVISPLAVTAAQADAGNIEFEILQTGLSQVT